MLIVLRVQTPHFERQGFGRLNSHHSPQISCSECLYRLQATCRGLHIKVYSTGCCAGISVDIYVQAFIPVALAALLMESEIPLSSGAKESLRELRGF